MPDATVKLPLIPKQRGTLFKSYDDDQIIPDTDWWDEVAKELNGKLPTACPRISGVMTKYLSYFRHNICIEDAIYKQCTRLSMSVYYQPWCQNQQIRNGFSLIFWDVKNNATVNLFDSTPPVYFISWPLIRQRPYFRTDSQWVGYDGIPAMPPLWWQTIPDTINTTYNILNLEAPCAYWLRRDYQRFM